MRISVWSFISLEEIWIFRFFSSTVVWVLKRVTMVTRFVRATRAIVRANRAVKMTVMVVVVRRVGRRRLEWKSERSVARSDLFRLWVDVEFESMRAMHVTRSLRYCVDFCVCCLFLGKDRENDSL